jgi:dUTP pyrophosphatase
MQLKVKRAHEDAYLPSYAHYIGDSGFDLYAIEDVIVEPGQNVKVRTGLAFELPNATELQIRPRSGITSKTKLRVQFGTIDSNFRGEVMVLVDNTYQSKGRTRYLRHLDGSTELGGHSHKTYAEKEFPTGTYLIKRGDRIAQGVIAPVIHADIVEVDELSDTTRGDGSFGSTGVR